MKLDLVIVDDTQLWLSLGEKLAENHPLVGRVTLFSNWIDAWVHLQTRRPDVVLTDIEMPEMNGISFINMFSASIPFISSSTNLEYASMTKQMGCYDFLAKPFTKNDFNKTIDLVHNKLYAHGSFLQTGTEF